MNKYPIAVGLAVLVGYICAKLGVPAPAPPTLTGVGLAVAVTVGYLIGGK